MRATFAPILGSLLLMGSASPLSPVCPDRGEVLLDPAVHTYSDCVLHRLLGVAREAEADWKTVVLADPDLGMEVRPEHQLVLDLGLVRLAANADQLAAAIAYLLAQRTWDPAHAVTDAREATRIAQILASDAGFSPSEGLIFWRKLAREHPASALAAEVMQDNLQTAQQRYRHARALGVMECRRPEVPAAQIDLYYASTSFEEGGIPR